MINLDVEKYCHTCPYFEPYIKSIQDILYEDGVQCYSPFGSTLIICKNKEHCNYVKHYFEKEIEELSKDKKGE